MNIDLNCDCGESFGVYPLGNDDALMHVVSSVNIACGFHAGDPSVMRKSVVNALSKGVAVGAHPGYPDRLGFGRRNMDHTPQEVYDLLVYQIGALDAFVRAEEGKMNHVKPHGALYNTAGKSRSIAEAIAEAVYRVNPELILYGLAGSHLIQAGQAIGLQTANEVFADRTYQNDGSLTARSHPAAMIADADHAVAQISQMITDGTVRTAQGTEIEIQADTICIHGDGENAVPFARQIKNQLQKAGYTIQAPGRKSG